MFSGRNRAELFSSNAANSSEFEIAGITANIKVCQHGAHRPLNSGLWCITCNKPSLFHPNHVHQQKCAKQQ
jgi:hypothetical protein